MLVVYPIACRLSRDFGLDFVQSDPLRFTHADAAAATGVAFRPANEHAGRGAFLEAYDFAPSPVHVGTHTSVPFPSLATHKGLAAHFDMMLFHGFSIARYRVLVKSFFVCKDCPPSPDPTEQQPNDKDNNRAP